MYLCEDLQLITGNSTETTFQVQTSYFVNCEDSETSKIQPKLICQCAHVSRKRSLLTYDDDNVVDEMTMMMMMV